MIRVVHAELRRLSGRRAAAVVGVVVLLFSVVSAFSVLATAEQRGAPSREGGTTVAALTGAGGATESFAVAASFFGLLVFVTAIALVAGDFSTGTIRPILLREPRRIRVVIGKLAALIVLVLAVLVVAEVAIAGFAAVFAGGQHVSTVGWYGADALTPALRDLVIAFAGTAGWAVYGTALGAVVRSTPVALGIGFAWAGPFENIVAQSWSPGYRWFPGQVLSSLVRGGTVELGLARAATVGSIYALAALAVAVTVTTRKDITS